jgi:thiopeptide-type bacteriocin biosynthesis protein
MKASATIKRNFIPGSEWVYFKIYTGIKTADEFLKNDLKTTIEELLSKSLIWECFYIRYHDNDFHLRIRFKISSIHNCLEVMSSMRAVLQPLMDQDIIWKVQLDTYKREMERYGSTIEASETVFFHDSIAIICALEFIENSDDIDLKWLYGLKLIDSLLCDFNVRLENKMLFLESLAVSYRQEMKPDKLSGKKINQKYANYKSKIESFFQNFKENNSFLNCLVIAKSNGIKQAVELIKEHDILMIDDILASHIHMTMNRLFTAHNRQTEYLCYEMLSRYYKTIEARKKYDPNYKS